MSNYPYLNINSLDSGFMWEKALSDLRAGTPVLIFDFEGREGETDMVIASQFATPDVIRRMRKDAGGLICTTIREKEARVLGLPLMQESLGNAVAGLGDLFDQSDLKYDKSSSFSLTINSRNTFTGISDVDRSITAREFSDLIGDMDSDTRIRNRFQESFRSPGHVHLLIAREGYFSRRKGHTELSTYVMEEAGLIPTATIVEMLSDSGKSMTRQEALDYAERNSLTFIEGKAIIEQWTNGQGNGLGGIRSSSSGTSPFPA